MPRTPSQPCAEVLPGLEPKNRHKEQCHRLLHTHGHSHGRRIPLVQTATPGTQGSHGRVGALTLHMWGWLTSERVCTHPSADHPGSLHGAHDPRPGRHPGCGCSYMCPAQVSSAGNPPAVPGMCQLGRVIKSQRRLERLSMHAYIFIPEVVDIPFGNLDSSL